MPAHTTTTEYMTVKKDDARTITRTAYLGRSNVQDQRRDDSPRRSENQL